MIDVNKRFGIDLDQLEGDGVLPDLSRDVSSKYMNFFLTYKSKKGNLLDPMIADIIEEIEIWECAQPESDNGKYPRMNRRAATPHLRFKNAVRLLILNLLQVGQMKDHDISLAISLNANTYTQKGNRYSPSDMTYDPFIDAYNGLKGCGYMSIKHKHYYFQGEGMCTKVIASELLQDRCEAIIRETNVIFFSRPIKTGDKDELIILRGEDKNVKGRIIKKQYIDTKITNKWRANLNKINRTLAKHEIAINCSSHTYREMMKALRNKKSYDPEQVTYLDQSSKRLHRIFSDDCFDRGGRFYHGWWQQVPQVYRKFITIDGQETVELDYSRFHISMCYAKLNLPLSSDPYAIHPKVSEEITKYAINAMLNAKEMISPHEKFNTKKCGMTWRKFIRLIEKEHSPLVENGMWANRYGLTLQFQDSELAEEILLYFSKQDIPCLPIHDSFIVPRQHQEALNTVMKDTYFNKFQRKISIKEK